MFIVRGVTTYCRTPRFVNALRPCLVILIEEEDRDIGDKEILGGELVAFGDQLREADIANDVVALRRDILLVDLLEVQHVLDIGLRIADVDLQQNVGRVVGLLLEMLLLVLVAIVVLASHHIAQD